MSRRPVRIAALVAGLLVLSGAAQAHPGHEGVSGLAAGLAHPLSGVDHVLAMLAVGVLAAMIGGRALWALPAAFLGMMALGGLAGMAQLGLPAVEAGIALSVLVLGLALAFRRLPGVAAASAIVGGFAVFHGYAHGAELPALASGATYAAGFLAATAFLHACGLGAGLAAARMPRLVRVAGGAMAFAGAGLLAGWL
ncbi:MAG: HupE/UreJ family protein [Alsobacter sp.]